ncbi:hypothetical protein AB7M45_002258 [Bradyrhizobium elkanii]|uniref:hypothetical protein n=1 Tax=Bradyrhizobium elkanii TaxID=29448 RepID=UPI000F74766C|nr:hypothetical protein [Bradyrhizobium elkanii]MCW2189488.1 hypothetical protein [Bradyrhizobium elkanii]NWL74681.1 hypothetical protein [Bradyrhizobium elkanii]
MANISRAKSSLMLIDFIARWRQQPYDWRMPTPAIKGFSAIGVLIRSSQAIQLTNRFFRSAMSTARKRSGT